MDEQQKEAEWYEKLPEEEKRSQSGKKEKITETNPGQMLNLGKYTEETYNWLTDIASLMKAGDRIDWAYNALRGVMHAMRDRMTPEEVFHLSARLPMLIRGLYLEGYHLTGKPEKISRDELLVRIEMGLGPGTDISAETAFKAVLVVLNNHISKGELKDIYGTMPADIKRLWDDSIKTYSV